MTRKYDPRTPKPKLTKKEETDMLAGLGFWLVAIVVLSVILIVTMEVTGIWVPGAK